MSGGKMPGCEMSRSKMSRGETSRSKNSICPGCDTFRSKKFGGDSSWVWNVEVQLVRGKTSWSKKAEGKTPCSEMSCSRISGSKTSRYKKFQCKPSRSKTSGAKRPCWCETSRSKKVWGESSWVRNVLVQMSGGKTSRLRKSGAKRPGPKSRGVEEGCKTSWVGKVQVQNVRERNILVRNVRGETSRSKMSLGETSWSKMSGSETSRSKMSGSRTSWYKMTGSKTSCWGGGAKHPAPKCRGQNVLIQNVREWTFWYKKSVPNVLVQNVGGGAGQNVQVQNVGTKRPGPKCQGAKRPGPKCQGAKRRSPASCVSAFCASLWLQHFLCLYDCGTLHDSCCRSVIVTLPEASLWSWCSFVIN